MRVKIRKGIARIRRLRRGMYTALLRTRGPERLESQPVHFMVR